MLLLDSLKKRRKQHNTYLWVMSSLPYVYLSILFFTQALGPNPLETLLQHTGHWAVVFYILSYAISPARRVLNEIAIKYRWQLGKRLSDWNFLIFQRRMLGLSCFYMASTHFILYFYLDLQLEWAELVFELNSRLFILVGGIAFLSLFVLAISSPNYMQKYLKANWHLLHKITHLVAVLILLHVFLEAKLEYWYFNLYAMLIALLGAERLGQLVASRHKASDQTRARRRRPLR